MSDFSLFPRLSGSQWRQTQTVNPLDKLTRTTSVSITVSLLLPDTGVSLKPTKRVCICTAAPPPTPTPFPQSVVACRQREVLVQLLSSDAALGLSSFSSSHVRQAAGDSGRMERCVRDSRKSCSRTRKEEQGEGGGRRGQSVVRGYLESESPANLET